jgi:hypothetical protein
MEITASPTNGVALLGGDDKANLTRDIRTNLIAVKDANLREVERSDDHERRVLVTQHENRELARIDSEKTRDLIHRERIEQLARENQDLRNDVRFTRLEAMIHAIGIKVGVNVAAATSAA